MATSYNLNSGFLISYDWLPALESLSGDDYKELLTALIHLQRDGTSLPEFRNPLCNIFAAMISPTIKRRVDGQRGGTKKDTTQSRDRDTPVDTPVDTTGASKVEKSKVNISLSDESDKRARAHAREREFVPPTVEQIRAYCKKRGISIDAEKFVDHYKANGWMVGKAPMEDWKAAVRNWARSEGAFAGSAERRNGASAAAFDSSFDGEEFFRAAVERAYQQQKGG